MVQLRYGALPVPLKVIQNRTVGPTLGQDNDYVYREVLGLSDDDIADMLAEGVITTEYDAPFKSTW